MTGESLQVRLAHETEIDDLAKVCRLETKVVLSSWREQSPPHPRHGPAEAGHYGESGFVYVGRARVRVVSVVSGFSRTVMRATALESASSIASWKIVIRAAVERRLSRRGPRIRLRRARPLPRR